MNKIIYFELISMQKDMKHAFDNLHNILQSSSLHESKTDPSHIFSPSLEFLRIFLFLTPSPQETEQLDH